ncbi:hypothetical protein EX895_002922 [Sporisorium graminicola]|uniref:Uncharacterized protein n=1 Tax=Sporisorium graminicola TaxID=280036 RepID=A0A4U7KZ92_9BASI|nr:hypothetical protein EX895_002922 [Sporisorium graminicola]TKY88212.1 hypothetical protein EX895_002922 [Sporisorium graminicola]
MVCFRGSLAPSPTVRRVRAICTTLSLYLEAFLCHLHTLFYFFLFHTYVPASRAWWDSSKGSAVVIYAPHNDAVARYVALRLSSGSPSSFALKDVGPTKRNPRAPYTCFVLHADPDQFSITVAQWAAKKARMEKALLKQRNAGRSSASSNSSAPSSPTSSAHVIDAESTRDGSEHGSSYPSSPAANHSNMHARRHDGGDETPRPSKQRSRPPPIRIGGRFRRRSRSWSSWATPDLFGYGVDMLKGWMPGRSGPKTTPSGTIIPIMADVQTADGLAMVNSTISAYCSSHDLLLSGIVLIPSVLCPRNVPLTRSAAAMAAGSDVPKTPGSAYSDVDPFTLHNREVWGELRGLSSSVGRSAPGSASGAHASGPRDPFGLAPPFRETSAGLEASMESSSSSQFNAHASPPLSPSSVRIVRTQDDEQAALHSALATDVVQSKALINVLFPALKRDKGRVLGLVPCGHGPDLPQDPDTLSLQSMPVRGTSSGKSRDRSLSSASSSAPAAPETSRQAGDTPALRTWPSPVVNTVREALRTQYRELQLEYRRRGGSARQVHVSMIETNALIKLPQTRLKKVVKWNESVRYFAHHGHKRRWWRVQDWVSLAWVLDRLPFVGRVGRLSDCGDEDRKRDAGRFEVYIPQELRPFLRGWARPFADVAGSAGGSGASVGEDRMEESPSPLVVRGLRRLVRVFRWMELCSVPWDDLAEHVAAVSYPIALGSSCPPTPGPSQSLLHPYTVSSNHASASSRTSSSASRAYPKPPLLFAPTSAEPHDDDDDHDTPDFPFSTASSGPAYTLLNVNPSSSCSSSSAVPNSAHHDAVRVPRTYPRELTHQDPTPLFEALRCALTSYHPRPVYYPALSAWASSFVHSIAPWIQSDLKTLLSRFLLDYAVQDARRAQHVV